MKKNIFPAFIFIFFQFFIFKAENVLASTFTVGTGKNYPTIQACADIAQAGDTCEVYNGTYSENLIPPRNGSSNNWITFKATLGQSPVIAGNVSFTSRSYIILQGFEIRGSVSAGLASTVSYIQILDNFFNSFNSVGISMYGNNILVSGNVFDEAGNDCIRLFGDYHVIRNNLWMNDDPPSTDTIHADFFQSFVPQATQNCNVSTHYFILENNAMVNVSGSNSHFFLINATNRTNNPPYHSILRHNKIHMIGSMAFYIDSNNQSGAYKNVLYNNTVSYPVEGIFSSPSWPDIIANYSASLNSTAVNNIQHTATVLLGVDGYRWDVGGAQSHTLYFSDSGTMTFAGLASSEAGAIKNQNPLLMNPSNNNFSLQTGSPAINAGGPLTYVASADAGSGTSLVVEKAEFFQPGWAGTEPDTIAIGSLNKTAQISSIDYDNNKIELATAILRNDGDPVFLFKDSDGTQVFYGSAPDIGAYEYIDENPTDLTPPANPSGLSVR